MVSTKAKKEAVVWDRRKILIFVFSVILLLILALELKSLVLNKSQKAIQSQTKTSEKIQGTSTENLPDIGQSISDQINNLQQEAQTINVVDLATSSPQVQKVINDLKAIQNLPQNQLKNACEKICNGL